MGGPMYAQEGMPITDTETMKQMIMNSLKVIDMAADNPTLNSEGRGMSDRDMRGRVLSDRDMNMRVEVCLIGIYKKLQTRLLRIRWLYVNRSSLSTSHRLVLPVLGRVYF
jgi:hypothetical protein